MGFQTHCALNKTNSDSNTTASARFHRPKFFLGCSAQTLTPVENPLPTFVVLNRVLDACLWGRPHVRSTKTNADLFSGRHPFFWGTQVVEYSNMRLFRPSAFKGWPHEVLFPLV